MQKFISCDWGTTSLRVRFIDPIDLSVVGHSISKHGIGVVHNLWKQNGAYENNKPEFYKRFLADKIAAIEKDTGIDLKNFPIIISGMASSSIGMMELPCVDLPVNADGSALYTKKILASDDFSQDLILVSGIKTPDDIARGEETQLVGCNPSHDGETIYIFPGTHSKHIWVKNGTVVTFKTYMTGEFLQLLAEKSILCYSIEEHNVTDARFFEEGVRASLNENLLNASFKLRTNDLFGKLSKIQNFAYLKGLLIGTELRALCGKKSKIKIVANEETATDYFRAASILKLNTLPSQNIDSATIAGHSAILTNIA